MTSYKFGDIVLVEFPQSTREQPKRRPALVILDIGSDHTLVITEWQQVYALGEDQN